LTFSLVINGAADVGLEADVALMSAENRTRLWKSVSSPLRAVLAPCIAWNVTFGSRDSAVFPWDPVRFAVSDFRSVFDVRRPVAVF